MTFDFIGKISVILSTSLLLFFTILANGGHAVKRRSRKGRGSTAEFHGIALHAPAFGIRRFCLQESLRANIYSMRV